MGHDSEFEWMDDPDANQPLLRGRLLLSVLREMDEARERLREGQRHLAHVLNDAVLPDEPWRGEWGLDEDDPEQDWWLPTFNQLRQVWHAFKAAGGVTEHDLRQFLMGRSLNRKPGRQKYHLRLVASKVPRVSLRTSQPRVRLSPWPSDGGEAA